jgi:protoporphyrinogen oxidase
VVDVPFPSSTPRDAPVVVIGAGPAGLTAAYLLATRGVPCTVVEADTVVGGIARTVVRDGWRFDLGGHRFFTKVPEVTALWEEILGPEDFLRRPRLSRIYYRGRYFDYPIRPLNALSGLGPLEAARCVGSYLLAKLRPPRDQSSFEGWVAARFGWRLYRTFFKTYTEKVWGMPATEIRADWAAQRIRNLSLGRALVHAIAGARGAGQVTSLIEEFRYPRLGPGMMWERAAELATARGATLLLGREVVGVRCEDGRATAVVVEGPSAREVLPASAVISSMPLGSLVAALDPAPPPDVVEAAAGLRHRDFLTVALVVPVERGFPDNWIYVHSPEVRVGRIQNFGSWSPSMVKDGRTCLGLEYFVFEGDDLWRRPDDELVALGADELERLGLVPAAEVEAGYVVRMPRAYPVYDEGYDRRVERLREHLRTVAANVHPVGRNGMHRYNNQDHSMLTAMLAVENVLGADYDVWSVNVDADYHEEQVGRCPPGVSPGLAGRRGVAGGGGGGEDGGAPVGTGRAAPLARPRG